MIIILGIYTTQIASLDISLSEGLELSLGVGVAGLKQ